jgi:ribosome-associated protein
LTNTETKINSKSDVNTVNDLIIDAIQDIKGKKILKLDLRKLPESPTDFFIICEGESITQVRAIAENIQKRLKQELGIPPLHKEGLKNSKWILIDYFDTVVHVFYPETREFYELEELWGDANITEHNLD